MIKNIYFYMDDIGFYCSECDMLYPNCWELEGRFLCSRCFSENVINVDLNKFRKYYNKIDIKNNAIEIFKNTKIDENIKNKIMTHLYKIIRKKKLEKLYEK